MKNIIYFLLLVSNLIVAMEAERKSLASFFDIDQFTQHADAPKAMAFQYLCSKQWWYVDKEIQFYGKNYGSNHSLLSRYPNYLKCVCFDSTGTKIIAFPSLDDNYYAYTYDRDGNGSECLKYKAYHEFYEKNIEWTNNLYRSGNRPGVQCYEDDVTKWLEEKFGLATMLCWNEQQVFIAPQFGRGGCRIVHAWNEAEEKILFSLHHNGVVNSVDFNPQGIEIITASADKTMRWWNKKTGLELLRFTYDKRVTSASFNGIGTEMVVATDDGNIQIFAQYKTDNLQQILLKKLLYLWLQLQMPNKEIDTPETLLGIVAQMLCCNYDELSNTWASFPKHMQEVIWTSMYKKIQRYGKKEDSSVEII